MRRLFALSLMGIFLAAAPASAQQKPAAGGDKPKATSYDFDDDIVEGDLVRPEGEMVGSASKVKHSSLIRIRTDFLKEMLKSAEDI